MGNEWLDIYDDQGNLMGQALREETHQKGYWHRTFHCWLYELRDGIPYVFFQRRQQGKDTNPLYYDITVAGHLTAGEQPQDAVREIEEEIGILVQFEQLQEIMVVKEDARGELNGKPYWDREISHVFVLNNPEPVTAWKLQAEEVMAVYAAPLEQLMQLFSEQAASITVNGYAFQDDEHMLPDQQVITSSHFVPRASTYYLQVLNSIKQLTT
ncbi:NUDIX domain-containing protein [Paenibacillus septentrionalis]|uniref:NUDIX domain-containing protein n=1 Tax=Paenibacillus septentrionalis TaxID=429342 RepID=A0ABW1V5P2_9BACL